MVLASRRHASRLHLASPRLSAFLGVALATGCTMDAAPVRHRVDALTSGQPDGDPRRYYEVSVPPDLWGEVTGRGLALAASAEPPEDESTASFVLLTDSSGVDILAELGLEPTPARLSALPDADADALLEMTEGLQQEQMAMVLPEGEAGGDGPMAPIPGCTAIADTFCQYTGIQGPCAQSIQLQLQSLAAHDGVELVDIGSLTTYEGRHLYGVRIGVPEANESDVPQLVLFGAQRAREWAGSGVALEIAKRLVTQWESPDPAYDWLDRALSRSAILIVPVANPDGYAYTFTATPGSRDWQKNRKPCFEEPWVGNCSQQVACPSGQVCQNNHCYPKSGVDVTSNFPFNWANTGLACSSATYEGPSAGSEAEVTMLRKMILDEDQTGGPSYVTRFLVSFGAYGNYVLYPDGITDGPDAGPHTGCRNGTVPENCEPPELGYLRWLTGSEAAPVLWDDPLFHTTPYKTDTIYRSLYGTVGDPLSHFAYSPSVRDFDAIDRRTLGVSVLLTSSAVGYYAECMGATQWSDMVTNQMDLVRRILENLRHMDSPPGLARPPELGDRTVRRIHRLRSDDDNGAATYGPARFWVEQARDLDNVLMTITPPPGFALGTQSNSITAGLYSRTFAWKPTSEYVFPGWLKLCPQTGGGSCDWVVIDGGSGPNLCSPAMFPATPGWAFVQGTGLGSDDCYLNVTGKNAGGPDLTWETIRLARNTSALDQVHLDYSYKFDPTAFTGTGRVEVAVRRSGGNWVTVRVYPAAGHQPYPTDQRLRTELVDLPAEFDNATGVQVRIRAIGIRSTLPVGALSFRAFDVVLIGRPAPLVMVAGCVDTALVAAVDPPGVGDANDVQVISGRDSPELCSIQPLGALEKNDLGFLLYDGNGGLNNGIGDVRQDYSVGGASASTDEAFFQTLGGPGPIYTTDDPLYPDLWNASPVGNDWDFDVPGVLLDTDRSRTTMLFTVGDRELGFTVPLQFLLSRDRRISMKRVAVWRLIRNTDQLGADIDEDVVRNWLSEGPVSHIQRIWGSGEWESQLREISTERQVVDTIFAQCPIEQRVQHRMVSYAEPEVDPRYVDTLSTNQFGSCGDPERAGNISVLAGDGYLDATPGTVNLYVVNDFGCGSDVGAHGIWNSGDDVHWVALAMERLFGTMGDGGEFVLAHELAHAAGAGHCNPNCVFNDLMNEDVSGVGNVMTARTCNAVEP